MSEERQHAWMLWVCTAFYGLHIMEEHSMNWVAWANQSGLPFTWGDFFVTNMIVIALGISCASVGWRAPIYALSFPGLMIVNGLLFHIMISLFQQRINPGCLSAIVLFLPWASATFYGAYRDGVATWKTMIAACCVGALWQICPLILGKLQPWLSY